MCTRQGSCEHTFSGSIACYADYACRIGRILHDTIPNLVYRFDDFGFHSREVRQWNLVGLYRARNHGDQYSGGQP